MTCKSDPAKGRFNLFLKKIPGYCHVLTLHLLLSFFFFSAKKCEEIKTYAKSYEPNENSTWFYSNLDKYGRVSWYGMLIKIVLDNLSLILRSYFYCLLYERSFQTKPKQYD